MHRQRSYVIVNGDNKKVRKKKRKTNFKLVLLFIVTFIISISILNKSVTNNLILEQNTITIPNISRYSNGFTILHISDLNGNEKVLDINKFKSLIKTHNFSAVCLTGDMVGKSYSLKPLIELINAIHDMNKNAPIYFICGDTDPDAIQTKAHNDTEVLSGYIRQLQQLGVIYLDQPMKLEYGSDNIWFCPGYLYTVNHQGTLDAMTKELQRMETNGEQYTDDGAAIYRSLEYRSRIMENTILAQKEMKENDLQIVLNHTPFNEEIIRTQIEFGREDNMLQLKKASLVLSGHYVAGQWRIPGIGAIYVPGLGFFPDDKKITGVSRILSLSQHISPGISTSDIYPIFNFRFLNTPTISLIKLSNRLQ